MESTLPQETVLEPFSPGLRQAPDRKTGLTLSVSIVIPAYNEAERLPETLQKLAPFLSQWAEQADFSAAQPFEIIVVDDGSQDDTGAQVDRFREAWDSAYPSMALRRVSHRDNQGKGAAMVTGILAARRDWVLLYDADAATPIEELAQFWSRLQVAPEQAWQTIFIGSRVHPRAAIQTRWKRRMVGRSFHTVLTLLFPWSQRLHDTQCGFKLFAAELGRSLAQQTRIRGYCWDVELLHLAWQQGIAVQELPVRWTHQPGSKVSLWRDPWGMLGQLLLIRLGITYSR